LFKPDGLLTHSTVALIAEYDSDSRLVNMIAASFKHNGLWFNDESIAVNPMMTMDEDEFLDLKIILKDEIKRFKKRHGDTPRYKR